MHLLIENADSSDPVGEKLDHMELGDMGCLGHRLAAIANQQAVHCDWVGVALPRVNPTSVDPRLCEPAKLVWKFCFSGKPTWGRGPVKWESGGLQAAWQLEESLRDVEVIRKYLLARCYKMDFY